MSEPTIIQKIYDQYMNFQRSEGRPPKTLRLTNAQYAEVRREIRPAELGSVLTLKAMMGGGADCLFGVPITELNSAEDEDLQAKYLHLSNSKYAAEVLDLTEVIL